MKLKHRYPKWRHVWSRRYYIIQKPMISMILGYLMFNFRALFDPADLRSRAMKTKLVPRIQRDEEKWGRFVKFLQDVWQPPKKNWGWWDAYVIRILMYHDGYNIMISCDMDWIKKDMSELKLKTSQIVIKFGTEIQKMNQSHAFFACKSVFHKSKQHQCGTTEKCTITAKCIKYSPQTSQPVMVFSS